LSMRRGRREAELMTALQGRVQQVSPAPALVVDVYGAMQMLRLGRCTVLALADSGELPRLRFGRAVRFAVGDVEALIEQRRRSAARAGLFRLSPPDRAELATQGDCGRPQDVPWPECLDDRGRSG
jgi:excisionase family DNA binding protein